MERKRCFFSLLCSFLFDKFKFVCLSTTKPKWRKKKCIQRTHYWAISPTVWTIYVALVELKMLIFHYFNSYAIDARKPIKIRWCNVELFSLTVLFNAIFLHFLSSNRHFIEHKQTHLHAHCTFRFVEMKRKYFCLKNRRKRKEK